MSLETWIEEFHPVPVSQIQEKDVFMHSYQKWLGLFPINIERHNCRADGWGIEDDAEDYFRFTSKNCSFCKFYLRPLGRDRSEICGLCPLYKARNHFCNEGGKGPYSLSITTNNPLPMLELMWEAADFDQAVEINNL